MQLGHLSSIAGGLNIEGGRPYHDLKKANPNALWVNLIVVLDRPFVDDILFSELAEKVTKNSYPLLENTIEDFNEPQMIATFLLTIMYYLEEGKALLGKEKVNIRVHVHQDKLSQNLIEIFRDLLKFFEVNTEGLTYSTDDYTYVNSTHNFDNVDILISLSQCAGLDPEHGPGKMYVTDTFIPFDIKTNEVNLNSK